MAAEPAGAPETAVAATIAAASAEPQRSPSRASAPLPAMPGMPTNFKMSGLQRSGSPSVGLVCQKPDTMSYKLFSMIGENAPMVTLTSGYKRKRPDEPAQPPPVSEKATWQWREFSNEARKDGLRLSHWERADSQKDSQERSECKFASFNTTTNVYSYSPEEYQQHLRDDSGNWAQDETDYLFGLCHDYDLRWFVIIDRYDWQRKDPAHPAEAEQSKAQGTEAALAESQEDPPPAPVVLDVDEAMVHETEQEKATEAPALETAGEVKAVADAAPVEEMQIDSKANDEPVEEVPKASVPAPASPNQAESAPITEHRTIGSRTLEDLKERYYSVCRKLIRARPASDDAAKAQLLHSYSYEKEREVLRKRHISEHILTHTQEQLDEEEFLYIESRRLEQTFNRTAHDREELWRVRGGIGPQSSSSMAMSSPFLSQQAQANAAAAAGLNNKKRRRGELDMLEQNNGTQAQLNAAAPQLTSAQDEQYCITRWDPSLPVPNRPTGVYLRSTKPPALKTSSASRITGVLAELGINMRLAMPTRANMEKLEVLVNTITNLLDVKKQVEKAEYELKILKTRKEAAARIEEEDKRLAQLGA